MSRRAYIFFWIGEYLMWGLIWIHLMMIAATILAQFHQDPEDAFHYLLQDHQYTSQRTFWMTVLPPLFIHLNLRRKKQGLFDILDAIINGPF